MIPNGYSVSPAQPAATHLTINHDVVEDLDSSGAFEGPEKLLEVWFASGPTSLPATASPSGLKTVPLSEWVAMLDLVNCKILSVLESDSVDAYLLSESSMFVFPHKLILKTCGTTTLLLGLRRLLHIAAARARFPFHNADSLADVAAAATPYRVFYSRKNFLFPDRQRGPHRSWKQEVGYLDDMFEEGGSAYMVGKMNGDHWYLYMTSPSPSFSLRPPSPPSSPSLVKGQVQSARRKIPTGIFAAVPGEHDGQQRQQQQGQHQQHDETLEILMMDLDPEHVKQFYHSAELANKNAATADLSDDNDDGDSAPAAEDGVFGAVEDFTDQQQHQQQKQKSEEHPPSEGHELGTIVSEACGLASVYPASDYPGARIDAYLFTPCGYSANGIVPSATGAGAGKWGASSPGHYWTVHVTPEPNCSFASFETNVPSGDRSPREIIERVVAIFRPGRFSVTLFDEAKGAGSAGQAGSAARLLGGGVSGYRRIDGIVHDFEDYDLVFRFYEREGWGGRGGTRVGEEV